MQKHYRKLCIIILNYNNEADTVACVTSVFTSECDETPYVVVVDNSDRESLLAESLAAFENLKLLSPGKNLGFGGGNNYGISWLLQNMSFDYLMVLNNDALLKRDTLRKMILYADEHKDSTLVAPCIVTAEEPARIWYAGGSMDYCRMTPRINSIESKFKEVHPENSETGFASGCAFMLSRRMYDFSTPLFDPHFFIYDEDVELSIRLMKEKKRIDFISEAVVVHKCQASQQAETGTRINQLSPRSMNLIFYLGHTIRNRYYIIDKHFKGPGRLMKKCIITFYWIMKSIQYALYLRFRESLFVIRLIMRHD